VNIVIMLCEKLPFLCGQIVYLTKVKWTMQ